MALIQCVDCGKEISDRAKVCPNCGCPVEYSVDSEGEMKVEVNEEAKQEAKQEVQKDDESVLKSSEGFSFENIRPIVEKHKKQIVIATGVIVIILLIILSQSCSNKNESYNSGSDDYTDDYDSNNDDNNDDFNYDEQDDFEEENNTPQISYISDRTVDYDQTNKKFRVFFGLKDENQNYMTANSGTATIEIATEASEVIYSKSVSFSSSDFSSWTNKLWDSSRLLACIYINDTELQAGSSVKGSLTISVEADGVTFSPKTISIYNLPVKGITVSTPSLPQSFSDYGYENNLEATIRVDKVSFNSNVFSYDDVSVKMQITTTTTFNSTPSTSKIVKIGYKLKNSAGVIVDSGTIYVSPSTTGETSISEQYFTPRLNMKESYTLELYNSVN